MSPGLRLFPLTWPFLFIFANGIKLLLQVGLAVCLAEMHEGFVKQMAAFVFFVLYLSYFYQKTDIRMLNCIKNGLANNRISGLIAPVLTLVICVATVKSNWSLLKINGIESFSDAVKLFMVFGVISGVVMLNMMETLYSARLLGYLSIWSQILLAIPFILGIFSSFTGNSDQLIFLILLCTVFMFIVISAGMIRQIIKANKEILIE